MNKDLNHCQTGSEGRRVERDRERQRGGHAVGARGEIDVC